MTTRRIVIIATQALLIVLIGIYGGLRYLTEVPGQSYSEALPPLTADQAALVPRLRSQLEALAQREHNLSHPQALEETARLLEAELTQMGFEVHRQEFEAAGQKVRNIEVEIAPDPARPNPETIIVGAHYDSPPGSPGADAGGSGTAAVLELARRLSDLRGKAGKRLRLVLFANGAPPYFRTRQMGSMHYAAALRQRGEPVYGAYALHGVGYFTDAPGSQKHAPLLKFLLPGRGNFIAFFGRLPARPFVQHTVALFRATERFPSIGGVGPAFYPGVNMADDWAFAEHDIPALAISDTGPYRNPHFGRPDDTPATLDFDRMARVVTGIERILREQLR